MSVVGGRWRITDRATNLVYCGRAVWHNNNCSPEAVASLTGLSVEQVGRVYRDIDAKRSATKYLHAAPQLVEEVFGDKLVR